MTRFGRTVRRWEYSRVGWMARNFVGHCSRCNQRTPELYKRYVLSEGGNYRELYDAFAGRYCKTCIEALWEEDDARDTMEALGG